MCTHLCGLLEELSMFMILRMLLVVCIWSMFMILRMLPVVCVCLLGLQEARAACSVIVPPLPRYVGNTATDNKCTDNDIQSAINAVACPGTQIYITGERNYTGQHLVISGQSLSLIGSASACGVANANGGGGVVPTAPLRTLTGSSTLGASVISIIGNSTVILQYLDITGGNLSGAGKGGGIFFYGTGSLTLDTTTVDGNQAGSGGGISMNSPGSATLSLLNNTQVLRNKATTSGGGILLESNTHLIAVSDHTLIGSNTALGGYGGGIYVIGPARADIGSSGYGADGVVSSNTAVYGGGIAARATQSNAQNAIVQLFTTNAEQPVNIQGNHASAIGGAIYLQPFQDSNGKFSDATLCAYNFRIDGNIAADGAAIYMDAASASGQTDHGSATYMNLPMQNPPLCGVATPATFGAVACAADAPCNTLARNRAEQIDTTPTSGATIFVGHDGFFDGARISLQHNQGGELIHAAGNPSASPVAALSSCLISSNSFTGDLIVAEYAAVDLQNCTIAGNIIFSFGTVFVHHLIYLDANSYLGMNDSIVDETNLLTLDQPGNVNDPMHIMVNNVLSNDITTLPGSPTIIVGDPLFTDARNGNYRLQAFVQNGHVTHSPAIDFSATAIANPFDLDGNSFGQDVPAVPNIFGPHDLGAYEMRPTPGRIFADGFGDAISIVY